MPDPPRALVIRLEPAADGYVAADAVRLVAQGATAGASGAIYYVHADHLNAPRAIVDAQNQLRWRWTSDPFGLLPPEEDPSGLGPLQVNLRLPGQLYDSESNLHYNYFRDYDPSTGRYVQSDPIGLKGGINTYTYVENQPTRYTDPLGLIYRCKAPLHAWPGGFFGGKGPFHHAFVCDDSGGNCYGQDWKNESWWHNPLFSP